MIERHNHNGETMKALVTLALALLCGAALATGKPPAPGSNATSSATSTASPVANSYGSSGDAWAVALPGHGSPSYAGAYSICVQGKGIFWNFAWAWSFDSECVRLIAELDRMRATPMPQKPVHYPMAGTSGFSPSDEAAKADTTLCDPPASDKPVRTAAAKNGKPAKGTKAAAVSAGGCGK